MDLGNIFTILILSQQQLQHFSSLLQLKSLLNSTIPLNCHHYIHSSEKKNNTIQSMFGTTEVISHENIFRSFTSEWKILSREKKILESKSGCDEICAY